MSEDYEIGYGKPPREHRFKPGNSAARKKGTKPKKPKASLRDAIGIALTRKVKVKRGDRTVTLAVSEVYVERLVQMMTRGSPREMVMIFALIEKYAPEHLGRVVEPFRVQYCRADGSTVELPPIELFEP